MKYRRTLTFIMLAMGLMLLPRAWAQEKPFTQQQVLDMVRAGLGNDEGAKLILQRGIDFEPTESFIKRLKSAGAKNSFFKVLRANAPIAQGEVTHMVQAGLGEDSGAQIITQRGIAFTPTEAYLQSLKSMGAKESFLKAIRAKIPVNQVQVVAELAADTPSQAITTLVKDRGVDFAVKDDYLQEVHAAGGSDDLVAALKSAKVLTVDSVDPAVRARQDELRQHVAQGAEFKAKGQNADAEKEFRAALVLDSSNADLEMALVSVLGRQRKWDDAVAAAKDAVRLSPNDERSHLLLGTALAGKGDWDGAEAEARAVIAMNAKNDAAHANLGVALGGKHDWTGEITEEREALRLNPDNDFARGNLGAALMNKGDWDGAIAEYHKALDLNPKNDMAHCNLAAALGHKGDWDGAIAEYREALRLNPANETAHAGLSGALGSKGDWAGAVAEDRQVVQLNPDDDQAHVNLADALRNQGDWDSAIAEYRAALKLNANNDAAHAGLGIALGAKGDLDGKISEVREALRLNPNNAAVHASLADALEQKGDRQGAQDEYHTASVLDPKNANYKQNYERLMR